jgi:adenosylhomocysteine nucleosidase
VATVGLITGLSSEIEALGDLQSFDTDGHALEARCAGARPHRAEAHARDLIDAGCDALVSFGIAGALDAALAPGTLVLADWVVLPAEGGAVACDGAWRNRLRDAVQAADPALPMVGGGVCGSDAMISTPQAKADLRRVTKAAVVDMESAAVARVAAECGKPFIVVRAVSDPAQRALPAWLGGVVAEDGQPRYAKVIAGLALRPWSVPALIRAAGDSEAALATLRAVALAAKPVFRLAG